MGKTRKIQPKKQQTQTKANSYASKNTTKSNRVQDDADMGMSDIDEFYESREKILLGNDSIKNGKTYSTDEEEEEVEDVYAIDQSDSEVYQQDEQEVYSDELDTEDEREVLAQVPGLRKHLKKRGVEAEGTDQDDETDEDVMAWGSRKGAFYNDDAEFDDDAIAEEVEEAETLQKSRLKDMNEDDFIDEFADAMGKQKKSGGGVVSAKELSDVVHEVDEDLEKINLVDNDDNIGSGSIRGNVGRKASKKELLSHLKSDSPELFDLLSEFGSKVDAVKQGASVLLERVKNGELETSDGISLLDIKNQLMVNYMLNLSFYFYLKVSGKPIHNHPVIEKLVELRLYMEKLKPIEQKLKHQIDRLVKVSVTGDSSSSQDALKFKADPSAFVMDDHHGKGGVHEYDEDGVYKPPKIAPVPYEDASEKVERKRKLGKASERMMRDAMAGFMDAPEEITKAGDVFHETNDQDEDWMERMRAEEELMTRLPMNKTDKKKMKNRLKNELEDLDDFGDTSVFMQQLDEKSTGRKRTVSSMENKKSDGGDTGTLGYNSSTSEDEYYMALQQSKSKKKAEKEYSKKVEMDEYYQSEDDEPIDGRRSVNYEIMKNKGLTPKRTKEQRNPRVKRRKKYEKSVIKLKSVKATMKDKTKAYGGEETGIKKNLAKSVRFS